MARKKAQSTKQLDERIVKLTEALLQYSEDKTKETDPDEKLIKANVQLLKEKEDLAKGYEILNKENIKNRRELNKALEEINSLREKLKEREALIKSYEESIALIKRL